MHSKGDSRKRGGNIGRIYPVFGIVAVIVVAIYRQTV